MKLLLLLLPLVLILSKLLEPAEKAEEFMYEFTVNSPTVKEARFDLVITGFSLTENGEQEAFRLKENNLKTPYILNLKNGQYKAIIQSRGKKPAIVSKVQGIRDGAKMGSAMGEFKNTILTFGVGGTYAASGE